MTLFPKANFRSPAALSALLVPLILGLALDLVTKHWAFERLVTHIGEDKGRVVVESQRYIVVSDYLSFVATANQGAVFGLGQGFRWLFLAVSVGALVFLVRLFAVSGPHRFYQVLLGMLLAGVLGNLYDRAVYGYVRDMVNVLSGWPNLFPWIFNVADSLLCTGVALMALYSFLRPEPVAPAAS